MRGGLLLSDIYNLSFFIFKFTYILIILSKVCHFLFIILISVLQSRKEHKILNLIFLYLSPPLNLFLTSYSTETGVIYFIHVIKYGTSMHIFL